MPANFQVDPSLMNTPPAESPTDKWASSAPPPESKLHFNKSPVGPLRTAPNGAIVSPLMIAVTTLVPQRCTLSEGPHSHPFRLVVSPLETMTAAPRCVPRPKTTTVFVISSLRE